MSDNREKYEAFGILDLKAMARTRGMKGAYRLKKKELIDAMVARDAEEAMAAGETERVEQNNEVDAPVEADRGVQNDTEEERRDYSVRRVSRGRRNMDGEPYRRNVDGEQYRRNTDGESYRRNADGDSYRRNADGEQYRRSADGDSYRRKRVPMGADERTTKRTASYSDERPNRRYNEDGAENTEDTQYSQMFQYDDAKDCGGILEVMPDGFGFIRSDNYLPGDNDVYVSHSQIRRFNLKTGDIIHGTTRKNNPTDKFGALLYIREVNGINPDRASRRPNFEDLTPIFPDKRIRLERKGGSVAMRIVDMLSPIGKGQRGMIVAQPKAGKTTLLKQVAMSVKQSHPEMHLIILLIDERPEEVTDMKETVEGDGCEVIYSTFDETPEHHKRVSEMVIERAKRLVEQGQDVMILLDSITRLARAYNLTVSPSGRTLSGGLDPAALHMPKRFFGAARNMREGGSLTILATALVETGSKMDDVVFEEFKGTGNMELVLDRKLSEKRVFPAIDLARSSTRREDLLLTRDELMAADIIRKALNGMKKDEAAQTIIQMFTHTENNQEFVREVIRRRVL
ncbi:transcription termination factor Rho [Lachnospiraceae bacterium C10]|nr:transcription termination factor Rho [Lachnospiraceae bacterium C10]